MKCYYTRLKARAGFRWGIVEDTGVCTRSAAIGYMVDTAEHPAPNSQKEEKRKKIAPSGCKGEKFANTKIASKKIADTKIVNEKDCEQKDCKQNGCRHKDCKQKRLQAKKIAKKQITDNNEFKQKDCKQKDCERKRLQTKKIKIANEKDCNLRVEQSEPCQTKSLVKQSAFSKNEFNLPLSSSKINPKKNTP